MTTVNWSDPKAKISKYFTVHEALWLPSWGAHHVPSAAEQANILRTAAKMDEIRELVGKPINVHCWLRPPVANIPGNPHNGKDYNAFIKGAPKSAHRLGLAVDWSAAGVNCDQLRPTLVPRLPALKIRMENQLGPWIHIDLMWCDDDAHRFFKP